jgi:hypothetical protein
LRRYQSPIIRASLHEAGIRSCIPPKSNRKAKIRWNRRMYRERNRIERMIGHLCAGCGVAALRARTLEQDRGNQSIRRRPDTE